MKKSLLLALVALSVVGMAEARRRGCGTQSCNTSCETECAPKKMSCCISVPKVVCVESSCDEGPKPDICGVVPAGANIKKHVHTSISYECAGLPECAAPATEEQINYFRQIGSVRPTTCCR